MIRAGELLGKDVSGYRDLYARIVRANKARFSKQLNTQTEKVLTLHFGLTDDSQRLADSLAAQITACGTKLQTGLVGTPYLLHELSRYGHGDIAWSLLLRKADKPRPCPAFRTTGFYAIPPAEVFCILFILA